MHFKEEDRRVGDSELVEQERRFFQLWSDQVESLEQNFFSFLADAIPKGFATAEELRTKEACQTKVVNSVAEVFGNLQRLVCALRISWQEIALRIRPGKILENNGVLRDNSPIVKNQHGCLSFRVDAQICGGPRSAFAYDDAFGLERFADFFEC